MTYWYHTFCETPCQQSVNKAIERQAQLTKPAGSLGQLEDIAVRFAGWQSNEIASLDKIAVRVFAADHGICQQNVSAFPQQVTMQMVLNFLAGGAAISVLSEQVNANFAVVNAGIATPLPDSKKVQNHPNLVNCPVAAGTNDFSQQAAMLVEELQQALTIGKQVIEQLIDDGAGIQLFVGGEMGIGNTSSASAIYCALLGISPDLACGPGTGIDSAGVKHKSKIINDALALHQLNTNELVNETDTDQLREKSLDVLQKVGGFEIAALTGSYIAASQRQIPSLIDGFISTAAALLAVNINPSCRDWLMFSHCSAEPAHQLALTHLNAKPLIDLGLRLGEGSGAAVCLTLIQSALSLHAEMATFAEAEVAGKLL